MRDPGAQPILYKFLLSPDWKHNKSDEKKITIFFFKSVQIYTKDTECSETNEKSNFRFFWFYFLSYSSFFIQNLVNFHDNLRKKIGHFFLLVFHLFRNVSQLFGPKNQNGSCWRGGGGGVCRSLTRKCLGLDHELFGSQFINTYKIRQVL